MCGGCGGPPAPFAQDLGFPGSPSLPCFHSLCRSGFGRLTIIVRLEEHLEEAKAAPCKIQEHTTNAPALGAFVVEVHVGLGTDRSTHTCDWYSKGDLLSLPTHVGTDRQTDAHPCH